MRHNVFWIYKIMNRVNGKFYVGQTRVGVVSRFHQHAEKKSNSPIGRAIRKYGKDKFEITSICWTFTQEAADALECYYIQFLKSRAPNGYNLTNGGHVHVATPEIKEKLRKANLGKKHSEESKRKMSESRKGVSHWWASTKGRKMSSEEKAALSQMRMGSKNPFYGKRHSEEMKRLIAERTRQAILERKRT